MLKSNSRPLYTKLCLLLGSLFAQLAIDAGALGAPPSGAKAAATSQDLPIREIYVPFEDLNVILDNDKQRVFLTREEYEALVAQARAKPLVAPPQKVAVIAAEYDGRVEDGRALIAGSLAIEVLEEGLWAVPLSLSGVGIRSATLDGQPAPLMKEAQQAPALLVQGKGQHKLELQLTAPLQVASAQQTLQVMFPTSGAARLKLAVPGNVEVKGGAQLVSRQFDASVNRTLLELQPQHGEMSIVLSLNNRLLQEQRLVVARSVLVDEVTHGYERLHATISYRPLHGVVDKLRLAIPAGFDVSTVESALLARWEEKADADGQKILETTLREPTSDPIVLRVVANRLPASGQDRLLALRNWEFPRLEPLEVVGHVAALGLVVEDRLQSQSIQADNLLPIDSAALAAAIPASVLQAEPGAPVVRQVASYFAPSAEYRLSASFVRPETGLTAATNSLLVIGEQQLTLQGGFALTPQAESLFDFRFTLPAGWRVTDVTDAGGNKLPVERHPLESGGTRVSVRLAKRVSLGETQAINYRAEFSPAGWLAEWTTQQIDFPKALVEGATRDTGAIAVQAVDDLTVQPGTVTGLTPLLENEKASFGLATIPTALAYRFEDRNFAARLNIGRTTPSLRAQIYSHFMLERGNLVAHYELNYSVRDARTRRVAFSLPIETPAELNIRGLDNTVVKESSSHEEGNRRHWTVQLAERQSGRVRLAIDYASRVAEVSQQNMLLPLIQAEDVEYQTAQVAVESDAELDVRLTSDAREVDIGELAGAERPLGRRVVGTFGYLGKEADIRAAVVPREPYGLPAALIERAELLTKISAAGKAQSVARYDLWTKATLLEIRLPAESTLWTIYLDNQPTKPQKEGASLLLSLPPQDRPAARKLQLVFESPSARFGLAGTIAADAPLLFVRGAGTDEEREIPQADLAWQLVLPSGYTVRRVGGTVDTDQIPAQEMALSKVLQFLYHAAGGIRFGYGLSGKQAASTEALGDISGKFEARDEMHAASPNAAAPPMVPFGAPAIPGGAQPAEKPVPAAEPAIAALQQAAEPSGQTTADYAEGKWAKEKSWALLGVSSLPIDIDANTSPATTLFSLGDRPRLEAAVVDQERVASSGWALGSLVLLVGIGLTRRGVRDKARYIIIVLITATVPPLLTRTLDDFAQVFDAIFFAGCLLILYYPAAAAVLALCRWVAGKLPIRDFLPATQWTGSLLLIGSLLTMAGNTALAQPTPPEDLTPVTVPRDAIIVPYDPEKPSDRALAERILVPYPKYVELWNLAHPDRQIQGAPPPADYAIAGTKYEAALTSGDYLSLVGKMEIEVYVDKAVAVPLQLAGGVLEGVTVDGRPARLQIAEAQPRQAAKAAKGAKAVANAPSAAPARLLLLHLSGKGRKEIQLDLRLGLARQGGWRVVRGQVPAGPAAALTLSIPDAGTEIRQTSLVDRPNFETAAAGERIETALGSAGNIQLQWRPKVAEGMVDQALTANSLAVLDIREDSLRVVWQTRLDFGRTYRDSFSLTAPADYLVEQVSGDNIRGWKMKREAELQRIDVTLLKPAQGNETLTLHLAKRGRVAPGEPTALDVPAILVEGASLEQGEIAVRKSPRLDVRTQTAAAIVRADSAGQTSAVEKLADGADASVLLVRPYQSFRFVRPPFKLTLVASPLPEETTAEVQAALRAAERETTLDAAILVRPKGQPLYRVRLYLPEGFVPERIGPGDLEWSVTAEDGRQLLTVLLLKGRTEEFTLTVFGRLAAAQVPAANQSDPLARRMLLPRIEVLDVDKQQGEVAVLPDPDTEVRLVDLQNCEASPFTTAPAWLKAEQRALAKAVLRYRTADYGASLTLTPRSPLVSVRTMTNVKVTPTSIEETILLSLQIEQAGIRRLAFLVPERLAQARLKARLLKQKTVEPATRADGQPIAGMVRVTVELQDFVRGEYAVLLEHERLLEAGKQTISLPVVESARIDRRLLAIENAGRDEVIVEARDVSGLEPITRQQQAWRDLAALLGEHVTQAYAALDSAARPALAFTTLERKQAERAGARIGLATTTLVLDRSGAYRALVQYRVDNATEQFLQLTLPDGARLWTAFVAGEPVKPALPTPPRAGVVRIPLVKSAEGEGDYLVELKYGGRLPNVSSFGGVSFPLIRETNINVELSQVQLLLPESQQWFNFQGTLRLVEDQTEMERGFQGYLNKRIQEAAEDLASGSDYTKVRAAVNLKQSRILLESNRRAQSADLQQNGVVRDLDVRNEALLAQAEQQAQVQLGVQLAGQGENRQRLNYYFEQQQVQRSKNVVSGLSSNFDSAAHEGGKGKLGSGAFNPAWIEQNKLTTDGAIAADSKDAARDLGKPNQAQAARESKSRYLRGGKTLAGEDDKRLATPAEANLPAIAAKKELSDLGVRLRSQDEAEELQRRAGAERVDQLQKYQQDLELKLGEAAQGQQPRGGSNLAIQPNGFGFGSRSGGGFGGQGGGGGRASAMGGLPVAGTPVDQAAAPAQSEGESIAQLAAGLASLDVRLPQRGKVYQFTTPRGDIQIRAHSIGVMTLARLYGAGLVVTAILLAWLLNRAPARRAWRRLLGSTAGGIAIVLVGLTSAVSGVLPLAGLLAIAFGLAIVIHARLVPAVLSAN